MSKPTNKLLRRCAKDFRAEHGRRPGSAEDWLEVLQAATALIAELDAMLERWDFESAAEELVGQENIQWQVN